MIMMSDLSAAASRDAHVCGEHALNPVLLIAATINDRGNIDLCAVEDGRPLPHVRMEFFLGGRGEILQRRYREDAFDGTYERPAGLAEPMDLLFLAEGLTQALGTAIPEPFRVDGGPGLERRRLAHPGRNRERLSMLHTAFAIQLLAYEEHLL
jgi:hypothetical protein